MRNINIFFLYITVIAITFSTTIKAIEAKTYDFSEAENYKTELNTSIADAQAQYEKSLQEAEILTEQGKITEADVAEANAEDWLETQNNLQTSYDNFIAKENAYNAALEIGETEQAQKIATDTVAIFEEGQEVLSDYKELTAQITSTESDLGTGEMIEEPTPEDTSGFKIIESDDSVIIPEETQEDPIIEKQTTLTSWFKNSLNKVINAVQDFFGIRDSNISGDTVAQSLQEITEPVSQTINEDNSLQIYQDANEAYLKAKFNYNQMKTIYESLNNTTYNSPAELIALFESPQYANDPTYINKIQQINDYTAAQQNLVDIALTAYDVIIAEQKAASNAALSEISNYTKNIPSDATQEEASALSNQLSTTINEGVATIEKDAQDLAFKKITGIDNPYTTLNIQNIKNFTENDLSKKISKLGIKNPKNVISRNNTIKTTPSDPLTFNIDTIKSDLQETLKSDNLELYEENPNTLFDIIDAYNILTDAYSNTNFVGRETSGSGEYFMNKNYADLALLSIKGSFEEMKTTNSDAYKAITSKASSTLSQALKGMKTISNWFN